MTKDERQRLADLCKAAQARGYIVTQSGEDFMLCYPPDPAKGSNWVRGIAALEATWAAMQ